MLRTVHALLSLLLSLSVAHATIDGQRLAAEAFARFSGSPAEKKSRAIDKLVQRGKPDAALVLIMELRYLSSDQPALAATLVQLTGANPGPGWADWVRWQEAHPETDVMDGFAKLKARVFDQVDPNFQVILTGRQLHSIRLEEITRGSARKDGISALTNPKLVFCVAISGDVRAYTFGRGIDELRCITASGGRAKRQLSGRSTIIAERSVSRRVARAQHLQVSNQNVRFVTVTAMGSAARWHEPHGSTWPLPACWRSAAFEGTAACLTFRSRIGRF
jgi:hypothetical protein